MKKIAPLSSDRSVDVAIINQGRKGRSILFGRGTVPIEPPHGRRTAVHPRSTRRPLGYQDGQHIAAGTQGRGAEEKEADFCLLVWL